MSNGNKWDANGTDWRYTLFSCCHEKYGCADEWTSPYPPDRKEEFYADLASFANSMSTIIDKEITEGAVKNQVNWAIGSQSQIIHKNHLRNYILCKAAALKTGFITSNKLPANSVFEI